MSARKYRHENGTDLKRFARCDKAMTPAEFTEWLSGVLDDGAYDVLISRGAFVEWYSPMTEVEAAQHAEWAAARAASTEKWERDTLARLLAKYGNPLMKPIGA